MHAKDENKIAVGLIYGYVRKKGRKFGLPLNDKGEVDRDQTFALQHATYDNL